MSDRDKPIGSADIQARLDELAERLKEVDRYVQSAESDLSRAKQERDRIKAEIGAWQKALAALKEAGIHL